MFCIAKKLILENYPSFNFWIKSTFEQIINFLIKTVLEQLAPST